MLVTTSGPKRCLHLRTQRAFSSVATDWKYTAEVMWPSASSAPICCTSASRVVRLPIVRAMGSSLESRVELLLHRSRSVLDSMKRRIGSLLHLGRMLQQRVAILLEARDERRKIAFDTGGTTLREFGRCACWSWHRDTRDHRRDRANTISHVTSDHSGRGYARIQHGVAVRSQYADRGHKIADRGRKAPMKNI